MNILNFVILIVLSSTAGINTMDHLYAPWRDVYLKNKDIKKPNGCPFCSKFEQASDEQNLIIKRFETCAAMLNLYPYGPGHILIIPYKHVQSLTNLTTTERHELMDVIAKSSDILEDHFKCDGINIGMNKGKASGGSVNDHLHIHIVPRFIGDTNFLGSCAQTKTLSFNIETIYKNLYPLFI